MNDFMDALKKIFKFSPDGFALAIWHSIKSIVALIFLIASTAIITYGISLLFNPSDGIGALILIITFIVMIFPTVKLFRLGKDFEKNNKKWIVFVSYYIFKAQINT